MPLSRLQRWLCLSLLCLLTLFPVGTVAAANSSLVSSHAGDASQSTALITQNPDLHGPFEVEDEVEESEGPRPPFPSRRATLDLPRLYASEAEPSSRSNRPTSGVGLVKADDPILLIDEAREKGEKWIEVLLGEQKLIAWEGNQRIREFIISSGVQGHETVRGTFRMWVRTRTQTMSGGNRATGTYYSLPNVEWVQYFYEDFAFHGTYWHDNFGVPMSHGCVNMTNEDAEWLFLWAMPEWDGDTGWLASSEENATLVHVRD